MDEVSLHVLGDAQLMEPNTKNLESVVTELTDQLSQLSAQLRLLMAHSQPAPPKRSPWLPLKEAAPLLHFSSARALKHRILRGSFPPDCFRQVPSPSGKRNSYLVNVDRYLKTLR